LDGSSSRYENHGTNLMIIYSTTSFDKIAGDFGSHKRGKDSAYIRKCNWLEQDYKMYGVLRAVKVGAGTVQYLVKPQGTELCTK
jgi:hypothetical protein